MDWNMASACAAWLGAITGIGNSVFSLVKYFKSKPRAKVTLSDHYSSYVLSSKYIYDTNSKIERQPEISSYYKPVARISILEA